MSASRLAAGTFLSAVIVSLVACGGGGGSGSAVQTAGTSEGFWTGATSTGYGVVLAVLEDGESWGLYTSGGYVAGAIYGKSTGSGGNFGATGSDFNLVNWSVTPGSLSGTVVSKSTINATSSQGTTISLKYSSDYDIAASLASAAGTYTMSGVSALGNANSVPIIISTTGIVTSSFTSNCSASGSVALRASGKNIYNLSMTFNGFGCALGNGGTASGILIIDKTSNPAKAIALALTPNKQDGFIAVGTKSTSSSGGSTTPVSQQTAEGLWNGTATPGGAVKTLVQANGAFYQFFGNAAPVGSTFGTSSVDSNNNLSFATSAGNISGSGFVQGQTVSASVVTTNTSLNYTLSGGIGNTRVFTHSYDNTYTSPFTQAGLVGNYSGNTVGQSSAFSIDANGNISGNAARSIISGNCPITGTIVPNATKRFATVNINGCSDSVNGIGVALLVGSGVGQQIYIGTQSGYGFTLYGVKQ